MKGAPHMTASARSATASPAVAEILARIAATPKPRVQRAAVAFSGGLDSSPGASMLGEIYHASEIVPITVDIGQSDEAPEMPFSPARLLGFDPAPTDASAEFAG